MSLKFEERKSRETLSIEEYNKLVHKKWKKLRRLSKRIKKLKKIFKSFKPIR